MKVKYYGIWKWLRFATERNGKEMGKDLRETRNMLKVGWSALRI